MAGNSQLPAQTLEGKVAIVTGSSRGLGAEMAMDLARRGAKVVITYTSQSSESKAEQLVSDIKALPNSSEASSVRADMRDASSPKVIVDATLKAFGPEIHVLVNNAGVALGKNLSEMSLPEDYDSVYEVNVRGVILPTQAVLPHLPARSRIINISSVGARAGFAGVSLYTSSKAALEGLTRSWAGELGGNGTTVNAVAPGPVKSDMLDTIDPKIVKMQMDNTPVQKRVGTAEEVANVVSWLAGPESAWISGQILCASGGWMMY